MKIIRPGVLNTEVLCGTCERCGCEVEIESGEELRRIEIGDAMLHPSGDAFVSCPTPFCGEQIRIYAK